MKVTVKLGAPLSHITPDKAEDLIAIKQKLGLPDARIGNPECEVCDLPERPGGIALPPPAYQNPSAPAAPTPSMSSDPDVKALVKAVADAVMEALNRKA